MDRSYERRQERSPLFKKSTTAPVVDLNSIIFGNENTKALSNIPAVVVADPKPESKPVLIGKPPLPIPR